MKAPLTLNQVLLAGLVTALGGGNILGNESLADELRKTREVVAEIAVTMKVAVTKLEANDEALNRRVSNLETLYFREYSPGSR